MIGSTQHELIGVDTLTLDIDNPRIQRVVEMYKGEIPAEGLHMALGSGRDANDSGDAGTTFYSLKESIKTSGTIIHPIHVNKSSDGILTVIEGNTRVAIYRELKEGEVEGDWQFIPAIVYENLPQEKVDSIRLQSHQVGPRAWDPYSKAKYLHKLNRHQDMPFSRLVDLCGGRKNEVRDYIKAYEDMEDYYRPTLDQDEDFDPKRFSAFVELQKASIKESIFQAGYELSDFSEWVRDKKIYPLNTVRKLPQILKNKEAKRIFLTMDAKEAQKYLDGLSAVSGELTGSFEQLCNAVIKKIRNVKYSEITRMREEKEGGDSQSILDLKDDLADFVKEIHG